MMLDRCLNLVISSIDIGQLLLDRIYLGLSQPIKTSSYFGTKEPVQLYNTFLSWRTHILKSMSQTNPTKLQTRVELVLRDVRDF